MAIVTLSRDAIRPSYASGFARCAAESANPGLWHGLIGAWVPMLGNAGLMTLPDVTPHKNNAAWSEDVQDKTDTDGYELVDGELGFYCESHDDTRYTEAVLDRAYTLSADWTIHTRMRVTSSSENNMYLGDTTQDTYYVYALDGTRFRYEDGTTYDWTSDTAFNNVTRSYTVTRRSGDVELWLDGISQGSQTTSGSFVVNGFGGAYTTWRLRNLHGWLFAINIYDRALTPQEVRLLDVDPLAPFRLAPLTVGAPAAPSGLSIPIAMRHYMDS